MKNKPFTAGTPTGECLVNFHARLQDDLQSRAELRRADDVTAVVLVPAYHGFLADVRKAFAQQELVTKALEREYGRLAVAAIAGATARIKQHRAERDEYIATSAAQMAQTKRETDAPRVSDLRFRRLLQASDIETLYPMLRRVIALLDREMDLHRLANDLWQWGSPFGGDRRRRQWAYEYYGALAPRQSAS